MRGFIVGTIVTAIAFFVLTGSCRITSSLRRRADRAARPGARSSAWSTGSSGRSSGLLALPLTFMTMGLIGFAINAGLLLLTAFISSAVGFDLVDRRLPADAPVDRDHRRRRRRRGRPEPGQHRRPACHPRLRPGRGGRRSAAAAARARGRDASGRRPTSRTSPRSTRRPRAVRDAFPDPWIRQYSVKANDVPAIVAEVAARGFGANVVSRGEWAVATRAGVPNDRITLEGVGKTDADLQRRRPRRPRPAARRSPGSRSNRATRRRSSPGWRSAPDSAGAAGRRSTSSSGSTRTSRPRRSTPSPSGPGRPSSG